MNSDDELASPEELRENQQKLFSAFEANLQKTLQQINSYSRKENSDFEDPDTDLEADRDRDHQRHIQQLAQNGRLESEESEDELMRKYAQVVGRGKDLQRKKSSDEEDALDPNPRGPAARLVGYKHQDHSDQDDDEEDDGEMRQLRQPVYPLKPKLQTRSDSEEAASQEENLADEENSDGLDSEEPEPHTEAEEEDEDKKKLLLWKRELEEKFKKFDSFKDRKEDLAVARSQPSPASTQQPLNPKPNPDPILASFKKPAPNPLGQGFPGAFQLAARPQSGQPDPSSSKEPANPSSRDSHSIKVKDELLANREKELLSKKLDDSSLSRASDHRPNFFSRKDADPFAQTRPDPPARPSPPRTHPQPSQLSSRPKDSAEAFAAHQPHLEENRLLKLRISDLETELARQKREHEHSLKQILDNNQKLIQNTRGQYEREIEHLKEQLEEAYIQNKRLEEEKQHLSSAKSSHSLRQSSKPGEQKSTQTAEDALEKNFMKLKALYDSLCRSNQELLVEHRELQEKYAKQAKTAGPKPKPQAKDSGGESRKPAIKMKNPEGSSGRLGQHSSSL